MMNVNRYIEQYPLETAIGSALFWVFIFLLFRALWRIGSK